MNELKFSFRKSFPERTILAEGHLLFTHERPVHAIMGPSGVGKSSLARWIAGLSRAHEGCLRWNDETWCEEASGFWLKSQMRRVGFLSQNDVLFPHLTVEENVAYGLRRLPSKVQRERTAKLLALAGLAPLAGRRPRTLSGGEKRRAALAQALAPGPRLLLLDEPFTGLDAEQKKVLWGDIAAWLRSASLATLLITHDRAEADAFGAAIHRFEAGALEALQTKVREDAANFG